MKVFDFASWECGVCKAEGRAPLSVAKGIARSTCRSAEREAQLLMNSLRSSQFGLSFALRDFMIDAYGHCEPRYPETLYE